jgi:hypothetical protein
MGAFVKTVKIFASICFLAFALIACGTNQNSSPPDNADIAPPPTTNQREIESTQGEEPQSRQDASEWEDIFTVAQNLGKRPDQIMSALDQFEYGWTQDCEFISSANTQYYLFGDGESAKSSACIAVGTNIYGLLPEDAQKNDPSSLWKRNSRYRKDISEGVSCYEYDFDKFIVSVYVDAAGEILPESPNAIVGITGSEYTDAFGRIQALNENAYLPASERKGAFGENINKYAMYLGTSVDVLRQQMEYVGEGEYGGYLFEMQGVQYQAEARLNKEARCNIIFVPTEHIFGTEFGEKTDMDYLKREIGLPFSWVHFDGYRYLYTFEDAFVYIESNGNGTVDFEFRVCIKEADYY